MNLMFNMNANTAIAILEYFREKNITDPKERSRVLVELAKRGFMKGVSTTKRSVDEIAADLRKEFNVLHIKEDKADAE